MDKLIALPVTGESFLLRRENRHVLVDGGYSGRALGKELLGPSIGAKCLDVVVCTHADQDHAQGLTDLLDKTKIKVGEFWLPGAWADTLPEVLEQPDAFIDNLIHEFIEFMEEEGSTYSEIEDMETLEETLHENVTRARSELPPNENNSAPMETPALPPDDRSLDVREPDWLIRLRGLRDRMKELDAVAGRAFSRGYLRIGQQAWKRDFDRRLSAYWIDLIKTAARIRAIASQAIRHGVRIRWFDFSEFTRTGVPRGGYKDFLLPLNSVEIRPAPRIGLSYLLRLSPVNQECLTFHSPGDKYMETAGVVFCGDSPMGYGPNYEISFANIKMPRYLPLVVTAPHHGSESNKIAYDHFDYHKHRILWVRSGGKPKHPGLTFRKIYSRRRACTHCPHLDLPRQAVEIQLDSAGWPWFRVSSHDCCCT